MRYHDNPDGTIHFDFARFSGDMEPGEVRQFISNAIFQAKLKGLIHRAGGVGTPPRPGTLEADQAAEVLLPTSVGSPS